MQRAQSYQKRYYDAHHTPKQFQVNDYVLLSTSNMRLRGSRKLLPRFAGPFQVVARVGTQAYKLRLPEDWNIHPTFHVSLLRQAPMTSLSDGRATPYLLPDQAEADFSDSDEDAGNNETTTTTAAPLQDPPQQPTSPNNNDDLNSSDDEAIDAISDDNDDLNTSDEEAIDAISDDH